MAGIAGKSNGVDHSVEWARAPPPNLPFSQRFVKFLYDPEEKSILGRTPKRWAIVVTFYLCFYAVLALMTYVCVLGLLYNIDDYKPHYTLKESLIGRLLSDPRPTGEPQWDGVIIQSDEIGANPGVDFRPRNDDAPTMTYDNANGTTTQRYIEQLNQYLKEYENETWVTSQPGCNKDDNYGLPDTPCFFIKLNKIYDWEPEYYDGLKNPLPDDMPDELRNHILDIKQPLERLKIWISCEEEKTNTTKIEYVGRRGMPSVFYPYTNERGYRSPFVAVRLTPPTNTLVAIRCRAWAKNILYNKSLKEPRGYTRILLLIEDKLSKSEL